VTVFGLKLFALQTKLSNVEIVKGHKTLIWKSCSMHKYEFWFWYHSWFSRY